MKKVFFAALCAGCVLSLAAQSGGSGAALLNVGEYVSSLGAGKISDGRTIVPVKYEDPLSDEEYYSIAKLGGSPEGIDTDYEALLATYYFQKAANIRPPEAVRELPANNRTSELRIGAAAYMDMQVARFTGSDAAPYAATLKFITDRGNVSEADIKRFMTQGIAAEVDAQFNKINIPLYRYDAVLTRTTGNQYVLSYKDVNDVVKELPPASLETLLATMRRTTGFEASDIDAVRAQAALIPAVSQAGKTGTAEPKALLTYGLTAFYTASTAAEMANTLKIVEGIYITRLYPMEYNGAQEKAKAIAAESAIYATLGTLNPGLLNRVSSEINVL
jgi:hypothetical protein